MGHESEETLIALIKNKSSCLGPKTFTNVFSTQRAFSKVPLTAENSPFDASAWIRKLDPNFKDFISLYVLSCVIPYHQIRVDEPLLRAVANY